MEMTLAIQLFRTNLRAKRRSLTTIAWYDYQFAAYQHWAAANQRGDQLPDADAIDAYLAAQHVAGHKPKTVHARWRALSALLHFLEARRKISRDDNPIHLIEAPSVPQTIRPYVKLDELNQLLATCDATWVGHRDRLILLLLFYSGLRVAELIALQVVDLDHARLEVTVRAGKGGKGRVVPFSPTVRPTLTAYLFQRPAHTPELWLASDGYGGAAGLLKTEGVRQMLIRRCKRAGLPAMSPHRFRHGFAMWLLNAGARLTTVATAMGHSDSQITAQVYAHTLTTTIRAEYEQALKTLHEK